MEPIKRDKTEFLSALQDKTKLRELQAMDTVEYTVATADLTDRQRTTLRDAINELPEPEKPELLNLEHFFVRAMQHIQGVAYPTFEAALTRQMLHLRDVWEGPVVPYAPLCTPEQLAKWKAKEEKFLARLLTDVVIEWDSLDRVAAVDVDYHGVRKPEEHDLEYWIRSLPLAPRYAWVTHNQGARLIYYATDNLTAHEVAALAVCLFQHRFPGRSGVQILHHTRHPAFIQAGRKCGTVMFGQTDLAEARSYLLSDNVKEQSAERTIEWMEENDYDPGMRYPHTRCPFNPYQNSKADEPVVAYDDHVHCFVCNRSYWEREAHPLYSLIRQAAKHRVHYEQFECYEALCTAQHERAAYSGLLKLMGPTDEDVARCFVKYGIVLTEEGWADSGNPSRVFTPAEVATLVGTLPAAENRTHREWLKTRSSHCAEIGYKPLRVFHGVNMIEKWEWEPEPFIVGPANPPFSWSEPTAERVKEAEDWLSRHFPGVNLNLLYYLIALKAVVQHGAPEPPLVFLWGESKAGKSAHVMLAAQLCCDRWTGVEIEGKDGKRSQGLAHAAERGSYALVNEANKRKLDAADLRDAILGLTSGGSYWRLYGGFDEIKRLPAIIFTDTSLPDGVRGVQVARRLVPISLGLGIRANPTIDWRKTCGTGTLAKWRAAYNLNRNACDTLVSHVIATHLQHPVTDHELAARFGYRPLVEEADADLTAARHEFFLAVCSAPEPERNHNHGRWRASAHWVQVAYGTRIDKAIQALTEGMDVEQRKAALSGDHIWEEAGIPTLFLDTRTHGNAMFVRFRDGDEHKAGVRFNEQLIAG
jgi:hypothetical protein